MYQVQACDANGACSPWSSPAITVHVFRFATPANLRSVPTSSTDGSYTLRWNPVSGATNYKIQDGNDMEIYSGSATTHMPKPIRLAGRLHVSGAGL